MPSQPGPVIVLFDLPFVIGLKSYGERARRLIPKGIVIVADQEPTLVEVVPIRGVFPAGRARPGCVGSAPFPLGADASIAFKNISAALAAPISSIRSPTASSDRLC